MGNISSLNRGMNVGIRDLMSKVSKSLGFSSDRTTVAALSGKPESKLERAEKGTVTKFFELVRNNLMGIGKSIAQANQGETTTFHPTIKNVAIASSSTRSETLSKDGLQSLNREFIGEDGKFTAKMGTLIKSAIADVGNDGHHLSKLKERNSDLHALLMKAVLTEVPDFSAETDPNSALGKLVTIAIDFDLSVGGKVLDASPKLEKLREFGGLGVLEKVLDPNRKLSESFRSEFVSHASDIVKHQCVNGSDSNGFAVGGMNEDGITPNKGADFKKGARMTGEMFQMGLSIHDTFDCCGLLAGVGGDDTIAKDHLGLPEDADKGAVVRGLRDEVIPYGGTEYACALAIVNGYNTLSQPGAIASSVLDMVNNVVKKEEDEGTILSQPKNMRMFNDFLQSNGLSQFQFSDNKGSNDQVLKDLKAFSRITGAGRGGDIAILSKMTNVLVRELQLIAMEKPGAEGEIEKRLASLTGATPQAAQYIAKACMEALIPTS